MTAPTTIKMLFLSFNFIGPLLLFQNILITLNKLSVNADHFTSYKEEKEHHTMTLTDSHLVFTTICQLRKIFLFEISRFQRWSLANASICTSYDNGGGGEGNQPSTHIHTKDIGMCRPKGGHRFFLLWSEIRCDISTLLAGAHFSKVPKSFRAWKTITKISNFKFTELFFSHISNNGQSFPSRKVSCLYTSLFLRYKQSKMASQAQKVFGAFAKRAPGLKLGIYFNESSHFL